MDELIIRRRELATGAALALITAGLEVSLGASAGASPLKPDETRITLSPDIVWATPKGAPKEACESAILYGDPNQTGSYLNFVRWFPGYMSAPHTYLTDRICVVISGTWWVCSGTDFDPASARPVGPGGFVRRLAGTPHYDGVVKSGPEAATVAIFGMGPVGVRFVDPKGPMIHSL